MELTLQGRRAIVTGASKGLGLAIAHELVREGTQVRICARSAEEVDSAVAELGELAGGRAVDVREADEFADGHVPGAVNLPLSAFKAEQLPPPSEVPVVLMCRSGRRAGQALAIVEATGRTDVGLYPGSMIEWTEKNGPVVTGP